MTFVTVEDQTTPPPPILDTPVYGRSSDEIIESVAIDSKTPRNANVRRV